MYRLAACSAPAGPVSAPHRHDSSLTKATLLPTRAQSTPTLQREISEFLYESPRWPEALGPARKPARPGRPGTAGGDGVDWAPKGAAPTQEAIRARIEAESRKGSAAGAAGGQQDHFPDWLKQRADFRSFMALSASDVDGGGGRKGSDTGSADGAPSMAAEMEMVAACSKPRSARTAADLLAITKRLRSLSFCAGFDSITLESLAGRVSFQAVDPGTVICRQGDVGDYFYLVLHGSLAVEVHGLGTVSTLTSGNSFGELALTSTESRQATVRALNDGGHIRLMRLHRDDYQEILAAQQQKWMRETVDFLAAMALFSNWSRNRLRRLAMVLTTEYAEPGQEVAAQGSVVERLYLVRQGELKLVHNSEIFGENRWPLTAAQQAQAASQAQQQQQYQQQAAASFLLSPASTLPSPSPLSSPRGGGFAPRNSNTVTFCGGGSSPVRGSPRSPLPSSHSSASATQQQGPAWQPSSSTLRPPSPQRSMSWPGHASRVPGSPLPRQAGWGAGSTGTLAYSPTHATHGARPSSPVRQEVTQVDASGHFPMALRRTKLLCSEPVGEVRSGACYGLSLIAHTQAHPFSLVAQTRCTLLYIHAKYLRPNALSGYDVVPKAQSFSSDSDRATQRTASSASSLPRPGSRSMRRMGGGDDDATGPPLPASPYTQVVKRTAPVVGIAHLTLRPPSSLAAKDTGSGGNARQAGQDELGVAFPGSAGPSRASKPMTTEEVQGVLGHVVNVTESVSNNDAEDFQVQSLLNSLSGTGVVIYPTAGIYLRSIGAATKHGDLSKRLLAARRNSLSALLPLDEADCEKILRRMMTRLDDDNRALQLQMQQMSMATGLGHGHIAAATGVHVDLLQLDQADDEHQQQDLRQQLEEEDAADGHQ